MLKHNLRSYAILPFTLLALAGNIVVRARISNSELPLFLPRGRSCSCDESGYTIRYGSLQPLLLTIPLGGLPQPLEQRGGDGETQIRARRLGRTEPVSGGDFAGFVEVDE